MLETGNQDKWSLENGFIQMDHTSKETSITINQKDMENGISKMETK